jgi:hypothetical protein
VAGLVFDCQNRERTLHSQMSDMLQLVAEIMDTQVMILPVTSHIEPCQS